MLCLPFCCIEQKLNVVRLILEIIFPLSIIDKIEMNFSSHLDILIVVLLIMLVVYIACRAYNIPKRTVIIPFEYLDFNVQFVLFQQIFQTSS